MPTRETEIDGKKRMVVEKTGIPYTWDKAEVQELNKWIIEMHDLMDRLVTEVVDLRDKVYGPVKKKK